MSEKDKASWWYQHEAVATLFCTKVFAQIWPFKLKTWAPACSGKMCILWWDMCWLSSSAKMCHDDASFLFQNLWQYCNDLHAVNRDVELSAPRIMLAQADLLSINVVWLCSCVMHRTQCHLSFFPTWYGGSPGLSCVVSLDLAVVLLMFCYIATVPAMHQWVTPTTVNVVHSSVCTTSNAHRPHNKHNCVAGLQSCGIVCHLWPEKSHRLDMSSASLQFKSSYRRSTSLYFCMACSARTFLAVSVATPTKIKTEVPANPLKACSFVNSSTKGGAAARAPRNADPRMDIRSNVPEM